MQSERKFSVEMWISSFIAVVCVLMFSASASMKAENKLFPMTLNTEPEMIKSLLLRIQVFLM